MLKKIKGDVINNILPGIIAKIWQMKNTMAKRSDIQDA
jgi:hypothetical protein